MRIGSALMQRTNQVKRTILAACAIAWQGVAIAAPVTAHDVDALDQKSRVVDRTLELAQAAEAANGVTQEQLYELDQKVRILERQLEIKEEEEAEALEEDTTASADEDGFVIESGDGAFTLKLKALVQGDTRIYADDEDTASDTFLVRRARPTLEGTVGEFISFKLMPDFAGDEATLFDAYVDIDAVPFATLRGGKFKAPVGLERLQSASNLHIIERGYPTELAPNRDVGAEVYTGGLINGKPDSLFSYAVAITNGAPDGRDSPALNPDDNFEYAARAFVEPITGLGFGLAGSFGDKQGGADDDAEDFLPRYRSPGQQTIFEYVDSTAADGQQLRWSPQGYYYVGSFGLLAEYIRSELDVTDGTATTELSHEAAQATAVFVLTGEDASFAGVEPYKPVDSGGWGALEVAVRYGWLDLDDDAFPLYADPAESISEANTWGVGLNWYLTKNLKAALAYFQTDFDAFAGAADFPKEKAALSRLQVSF
jgi:phosphate-selective porin OprO/OprP